MTDLAARSRRASIDTPRVFHRVAALISAQGVLLFAVSAFVVGLPHAVGTWLMGAVITRVHAGDLTQLQLRRLGLMLAFALFTSMFNALIAAWATRLVVARSMGDSPVNAWRTFIALGPQAARIMSVGLLFSLGVTLCSIVFVIPGFIAAAAWAVAVPSLVNENLNPIGAFIRSRNLTLGRRWSVIGCLLLTYLPFNILILVMSNLTVGLAASTPYASLGVAFVLMPLMRSVQHVLIGAMVASIYVELVTLKEGGFGSNIADAFD